MKASKVFSVVLGVTIVAAAAPAQAQLFGILRPPSATPPSDVWRGAPEDLQPRIDWLLQKISRSVSDGSLELQDARRAQPQIEDIRSDAFALRQRLDNLGRELNWRPNTYGGNRPPEPRGPGYNANWDHAWRGAPEDLQPRIDWLLQKISRSVADGSLDIQDARRAQAQLEGMRFSAGTLRQRLDNLGKNLRWRLVFDVWRGAPEELQPRIDWLLQEISRGVSDGRLELQDARRAQPQVEDIRSDAFALRQRLDNLGRELNWRPNTYGGNRPPEPRGPGYGSNWDYVWRGAPEDLQPRIDWLLQKVSRAAADGSLDIQAARRAQTQLEGMRFSASTLRQRLDNLGKNLRWRPAPR
jgi:hypothetical protein